MNTEPGTSIDEYCRAVEEVFVRLRGSPGLLSPPDWQLVRHWHSQGIPIDLVERTLEEVVARRRKGGSRGVISSLRYFAAAVETAWSRR
ncbi:MAG: hypothetical protein M3O15_02775 [Acidobacteriota bacterium]|nr:hypothetical protein [Acidobacteriota bacterium]